MKKKTPKSKNIHPHDAFFKETFSIGKIAKTYIQRFLPDAIVDKLDLDRMVLDNNSYITPELAPYYSDLVWLCPIGKRNTKIAFLLEHKSYPVKYPHLQLLRYMLAMWDRNILDKKPLLPIIPIILFHGKRRWKVRKFEDYFPDIDPVLWQYLPSFHYELTDLSRFSPDQILQLKAGMLVNALLALQYGNDSAFIRRNFALFFHDENDVLSEEHNTNFIELIIVYLLKKSEFSAVETKELLETISNPVKDNVMTSYDNLIAFGKLEGKAEGTTETKYEVVKKAHSKGYPAEEIADLVGIPIQKVMEMIKEIESKKHH